MKLEQEKAVNRLVIYFFYDKDGIVDRYVPTMLEEVKKNCTDLMVVCNGKLTAEGREIFNGFTSDVLVRDNDGFDVWAYKEALEQYEWEELYKYDEVIMMNHTIMGPVYPFREMFAEMDKRDVDFWGITKHHKISYDPFGVVKYGYIPEHIQSHFIAVRKSMLKSREFKKYWKNRPEIKSYNEAIGCHEAIFTKTFADAGFKWDVYVDSDDYEGFVYYSLMMDPVRMIRDHHCPIFKRRSFIHEYHEYLANSSGSQAKDLMRYLKQETDYDTGMIWENIIRTTNMAVIKECQNLNFILPKDIAVAEPVKKKTALVIHAYFEDLIDYCYEYALSMPDESDIYITVGSEKKKKAIEETFSKGPWKSVKVILIENIGRDVSALLVGAAPYLMDYDYVCFMHDKKVTQLDAGIKGYAFSERCFQNMLASRQYVQNVLNLFENEPYLGMICPPPPNHADYYPTMGLEWGPNYDATIKLAKKLKLKCPISVDKEPVAPLGTMFWFRPAAMEHLLTFGWKYSDFPKEPIQTDGTVLHAVERIYPYVVQDAGYYCGWVLNDDYARTEWHNLAFMLRNINIQAMRMYGNNSHFGLINTMNYFYQQSACGKEIAPGVVKPNVRMMIKNELRDKIPKPIWFIMKKVYRFFGGKKWLDR